MSVIRINKFEAKEGMASGLHDFLMLIVPLVEQSQGCMSCQVLQNQENRNEFVVIEAWDSVGAHQASTKNIPPEKICVLMSNLANPPSGSYFGAFNVLGGVSRENSSQVTNNSADSTI